MRGHPQLLDRVRAGETRLGDGNIKHDRGASL